MHKSDVHNQMNSENVLLDFGRGRAITQRYEFVCENISDNEFVFDTVAHQINV